MNKKVIYISWTRLTDKYARDWYIDYLIQNGVTVEYWDIIALTREQHNEICESDVNYLSVIQSYEEFEDLVCLDENVDAIYVMLITPFWRTRGPFRLLSKYNCKMVFVSWGAMPVSKSPMWRKIVYKLIATPFKFFKLLFAMAGWFAYKKMKLVKPFEIVFTAGSKIIENDQFAKQVVPINLCDYENYIRVQELNTGLVKGKYAVFLDINLPYQSDIVYSGVVPVDPITYYQSLNRFFNLLEQQYGIKIVIAAHPKANVESDVFNQREAYRLCTAELVKDAEFVLTHHSTALSYAVLNLKPCVFIYTNEMQRLYSKCRVKWINTFANYLESPVYNIDQIKNGNQIVVNHLSPIRYDDYKYSFLTSKESENLVSKDIFLKEINQLN